VDSIKLLLVARIQDLPPSLSHQHFHLVLFLADYDSGHPCYSTEIPRQQSSRTAPFFLCPKSSTSNVTISIIATKGAASLPPGWHCQRTWSIRISIIIRVANAADA
jgi:hypothetical protein